MMICTAGFSDPATGNARPDLRSHNQNFNKMKFFKFLVIILLAIAAQSCVEEPVMRNDDPIVHPPPPPKP
jgi:hypothetical protein